MTTEHTLSSLISEILEPAFSCTVPRQTLTKRFDRNCQKQHRDKTSSISQVLRKPPILRRLLPNLSTRVGLRASPHSKLESSEMMHPPYSRPGLLIFSELAETRIRQIIHISEEFWDEHCRPLLAGPSDM